MELGFLEDPGGVVKLVCEPESPRVASCVLLGEDMILVLDSPCFLERLPRNPKIRPEEDVPLR